MAFRRVSLALAVAVLVIVVVRADCGAHFAADVVRPGTGRRP